MIELLEFISYLIDLYTYIIIAGVIMSWLMAFGRDQCLQSDGSLDLAGAKCGNRAAARTNPPHAAEHGRRRYFADYSAARLLLHPERDPAKYRKGRRLNRPAAGVPWRRGDAGVIVYFV